MGQYLMLLTHGFAVAMPFRWARKGPGGDKIRAVDVFTYNSPSTSDLLLLHLPSSWRALETREPELGTASVFQSPWLSDSGSEIRAQPLLGLSGLL